MSHSTSQKSANLTKTISLIFCSITKNNIGPVQPPIYLGTGLERHINPEIYERVKGNWKLDVSRANSTDYIVAVFRGKAIGIYQRNDGTQWIPSNQPGRFYFDGVPASESVWQYFVGENGRKLASMGARLYFPIGYYDIEVPHSL